MLRSLKNKKGQAIMEYALIIAVIGAAGFVAIKAVKDKYKEGIATTSEAIDDNGGELVTALTP